MVIMVTRRMVRTLVSRMSCMHVLWMVVLILLVLDITLNRYSVCNTTVDDEEDLITSERPFRCAVNIPCRYPETVDFRIIVITYNRNASMLKCLNSLQKLELDGAVAALEIWIDQSKSSAVHYNTLQSARHFKWSKGISRVHVQEQHVGIYGQWIDTWSPTTTTNPGGRQELALILEDDISVSPYVWRWIRDAHAAFGARPDVLGYTLQSENVKFAAGSKGTLVAPKDTNVYLNRQMGSWGFTPHPKVWADFQRWFHKVRKDKSFKPYVGGGVAFDAWYKSFEKKGSEDSMWTIWFMKYTNERNLYCVYNNLGKFETGGKSKKLAVHRAEPGLHYTGRGKRNEDELLSDWKDAYVRFPQKVARYEFNGSNSLVTI